MLLNIWVKVLQERIHILIKESSLVFGIELTILLERFVGDEGIIGTVQS